MTTARYRSDRANRVSHGKTLIGRVEPRRDGRDDVARLLKEHKERSEGR